MFGVEARARLAAFPVALVMPWQCALEMPGTDARTAAPALTGAQPAPGSRSRDVPPAAATASAASVKQEASTERVSTSEASRGGWRPRVPTRTITLADEVVVKAMSVGQPAFLRCWARAQRIDALDTAKIRLHLEIDAAGRVTASHSDSDSPTLSSCLAVVARQLPFPAPGLPAMVDVPLMFR
jgi:hypothetical protein